MKEYYAHSENANGEKETLEKHLSKTAKLAEGYASSFDEGIAGKWLGIFHDAGKASALFQGVLEKKEYNVNHAAAGACLLSIYKLLARVIYAHHDGLQWHINDDLKRSYSESGSYDNQKGKRFAVTGRSQYNEVLEYIREKVGIPKASPVFGNDIDSFYKHLPEMTHSRMLLSCLCDSDYTATASHYDEEVLKQTEEISLKASGILEALEKYRENIINTSNADNKIVHIRNEVYESCLKAALCEPGMYTLTAPTGTGKTLALMAFAARHALQYNKRRIIIVLPYLSIISQNAQIYREICGDVLEAHSMVYYSDDDEIKLISERWNLPVVVTTSVKFFEAFFKSKPSDLRFLHSISNSVVVFDEAQSIPYELIGTTIETMRVLCEKYKSTVLFSTATQPAFDVRSDIIFNAKEIMPDSDKLYKSTRRVKVEWRTDEKTKLENIATEMAELNSVCCVLNRKDHTHKLYEILSNICNKVECFHISTDMCKSHRDSVIRDIIERLSNDLPCRLVSTSCIEAGVDLDFEVMYRSLAPLDSIVQCAGRCNRNGRGKGKMTVFIPDEDKLYPMKYFENAAKKVELLKKRHPIDINDPIHIREYYTMIFEDNNYNHDKPELVNAIEAHDFEKVEKEYMFIPNKGVNVIVPYEEEIDLFEELAQEAREKGISKSWIQRAAPITVTSYREKKLKDIAQSCKAATRKGKADISGWYILLDETFYDKNAGLRFDDDSSLDYLV